MIEYDTILREMGRVSYLQKIQLCLLMIPGFLTALHMGSNVFIGAEIDHWCTMDVNKTNHLEQTCNKNWTDFQDARYRPYDPKVEKIHLLQCKRYDFSTLNVTTEEELCEYWWPTNSNNEQQLNKTLDCESWTFATDGIFQSTIVSDFSLVCGQSFKRKLSQAFFMCGTCVGASVWGQVSDRLGRKTVITVAMFCAACLSVANMFSPNLYIFLSLRGLIGMTVFGPASSAFVLSTESVSPKHRVIVAQFFHITFAFGLCLLALFGYFIRNWRTLQLAIGLPLFASIFLYWALMESPRWLISKKKFVRANEMVKKYLKGIGKSSSDSKEATKLEEATIQGTRHKSDMNYEVDDDESVTSKHRYGPTDLLRTPNVRKKSLVLFYSWMTASCVYYGLTLNSADIGGDPFINLFLSGIIEVPALVGSIFLMDKWGRRPTLSSSFILAGVACTAMQAVTKDMRVINIVLSLTGKFGASAAFAAVYVFASEVYATPIRNVGIGICSSCARIGGILAPFIAMLATLSAPLPYLVFGGLSIVGGLLCLLLPETYGTKLPETIDECENFGANQLNPLRQIFCCEKVVNDHKYEECNRNDRPVLMDEVQLM